MTGIESDKLHPFEKMENAVIAALAPLEGEGVKEISPYVGQYNVDKLEDLLPRFPSVFVAAGELVVPDSPNAGRVRLGVTLLVGDQNRRSMKDSIRGDSRSPGVYHMLARCQDLLHGKVLIPGWRSFRVASEQALVYLPKERICIFNAFYTTEF
ncbi:DUF1834 family protein [Desulfosarcina sp. OttesenSCG-928-B08]|nr:DUF1834 family protein [Desulfosarcina sp. OttesenSCG-928-B08]